VFFIISLSYFGMILAMKDADFRFIRWPVYQDAKEFARTCSVIAGKLPAEHRFGLASQILRSSTSVALNIAEGAGKQTDKDFNRYLNIARGSLFESIATLDVLKELNLIAEENLVPAVLLGKKISHQISGLKRMLSL
jgi:four helix bundle protein